jgi:hypothetical protein
MSDYDDVILGKSNPIYDKTMEKLRRDLSKYQSKKDIKIDHTSLVTQTDITFTPKNMFADRNSLRSHYDQLLNGKVESESMKNKVIRYAELLMQDTTYCKVDLFESNKHLASCKVVCCLPEMGQAFVNWWDGKEIDSNNFPLLVKAFENDMKIHNISTVKVETSRIEKGKINNVKTMFTFV